MGFAMAMKKAICTLEGNQELYIENFGSLGDYSSEKIVIHTGKQKMLIEGKKLQIEYFSEAEMKIKGMIQIITL